MRIIFVRHGHPNYELDCLTPLGHKHGEEVAERLRQEPIEKIYSSTCGRALETAEHIDRNFGLGVEGPTSDTVNSSCSKSWTARLIRIVFTKSTGETPISDFTFR